MKIPTIKGINKKFEKKFLEYSGKNDYCLEEGWYLKKGNNCQVIWSIKQFYQDKMLKVLEYLEGERKEIDNMKFLGSKEDQIGVQRDMGYNQAVKELKEKIRKVKK